ncbi:hypothetical protein [Methylibium sp. T29]|uniref:hypothetical protein n=1 Tax=Methylibium sp. T29 TaxID=1430884 RepID=UPI0012690175|nr:hypothetical protein [Methylibium sp. T29]
MIDNWTLQDVEGLLSNGIGVDTVGEILISQDRQSHSFKDLPEGVLQIDALLTLLTNLICFDHLTVDSRFLYTWHQDHAQLLPLANLGVVVPQDYGNFGDDLNLLREAIVGELCVTPTLKSEITAIQAAWRHDKSQINPHLSALLWGGAGILARSHLSKTPYFGHPFRRRLLQETKLFPRQPSAVESVTTFIQDERTRMFRFRGLALSGSVAHVSMPPLAIRAIESADNIEQLLPAALNLRDQNAELRTWISEYQDALDEEDERRQLKYENVLRDISRALQAQYGANEAGGTGVSISTAFFKLDLPKSLLDRVRNSFGVRSTLCNLVLAPRGAKALEKLLAMLGEGKSLLGRDVLQGLQARYSVNPAAGA